jgi:hypothetical protein
MPLGGLLGPLIGAGGSLGGAAIGANAAKGAGADLLAKGNLVGQSLDKATQGAINAGYAGIGQANTALNTGLGAATGALNTGLDKATGAITGGVTGANQLLGGVLGQQLGQLSPYLQAGGQGVGQLAQFLAPGGQGLKPFTADMMSQYDPGYQFRLDQGQKALEHGAAARGGVLGGAQQKALTRYGQDYGSNEYQNAWSRYMAGQQQQYGMLSGLAGLGLNATGQAGNALGNYGARAGGNLMTGGQLLGQANLGTAQELGQANLGVGSQLAQTAMQGNQYVGNIGLQGAELAGNAYMGGALGGASGQIAAGNAWAQGLGNAAGILGGGLLNNYWNQQSPNLPIDTTVATSPAPSLNPGYVPGGVQLPQLPVMSGGGFWNWGTPTVPQPAV